MTNPGLTDLVGYWPMDEEEGTRYDRTGTQDLLDPNSPLVTAEYGKRGRAANIIASRTEGFRIANNASNDMSGNISFAMGGWFDPHSVASTQRIIGKWTTGDKCYLLYMFAGGGVWFIVFDGTSNYQIEATSFGDLVAGSIYGWYFVAGYFNAATNIIGVGVNDVWNTAAGPTGGVTNYTGTDFTVGIDDDFSSDPMNGMVDELFMYQDRVLTSAEWTWLYNDGHGVSYFDIADTPPPTITIETPDIRTPVEIFVLDSALAYQGIIDDYITLVWAERYTDIGDFELELPISHYSNPLIAFGNILTIKTSDKLMVIEDIKQEDKGESEVLVVQGKSVESFLKRRVIEEPFTILEEELAELAMYKLLWNNMIMPLDIKNGTVKEIAIFSKDYPRMYSAARYEEQFEPSTLFDIIKTICDNAYRLGSGVPSSPTARPGLGFKIVNYNDELFFHFFYGVERDHNQLGFVDNPYVVFGPEFHNVQSSSIYESEQNRVTVALVLTDDTTYPLVYVWSDGSSEGVAGNEPEDLERIETVIDMKIDRDAVDPAMTNADVLLAIETRGREEIITGSNYLIEGEFDTEGSPFTYGVDFFMGDIVQCYLVGKSTGARVVEVVRTYSLEGRSSLITMDFDLLF